MDSLRYSLASLRIHGTISGEFHVQFARRLSGRRRPPGQYWTTLVNQHLVYGTAAPNEPANCDIS